MVLPALAFFLVLYLYPIARLFALSLFDPDFTLKHYRALVDTATYVKTLRTTMELSVSVTAIALLLGYPFAYLMATTTPRVRAVLLACVLVPFWTSILVRSFAWLVLLGRNGLVNQVLVGAGVVDRPLPLIHNRIGVLIGMVHVLLPFMVLPIFSLLTRIDPALVRAARSLGASPARAFLRVTLPLSVPGIGAGCLLVFLSAVGFYVTPALLGGRGQITVAMLIDLLVNDLLNWGLGAALSVVLLVVVAGLFVLYAFTASEDRAFGVGRG
jgi:ABC-type spermidine/putrescine transport system permease subunit I